MPQLAGLSELSEVAGSKQRCWRCDDAPLSTAKEWSVRRPVGGASERQSEALPSRIATSGVPCGGGTHCRRACWEGRCRGQHHGLCIPYWRGRHVVKLSRGGKPRQRRIPHQRQLESGSASLMQPSRNSRLIVAVFTFSGIDSSDLIPLQACHSTLFLVGSAAQTRQHASCSPRPPPRRRFSQDVL